MKINTSKNKSQNQEIPKRVLTYHPSFLILKYILILCSLSFVGLSLIKSYHYLFSPEKQTLALYHILTGLVEAFAVYIIYYIFIRHFSITTFNIFNDKIIIKIGKKIKKIVNFKDIIEIDDSKEGTLRGGFTLITKDGEKIKIKALIKRCEYILEALVVFNQSIISEKKYKDLRLKLITDDHSISRNFSFMSREYFFINTFFYILLPIGLTVILYTKQSSEFHINNYFNYFIYILKLSYWLPFLSLALVTLITKKYFDNKIKQQIGDDFSNKTRDTSSERKFYTLYLMAFSLIYVMVFLFIYKTNYNVIKSYKFYSDVEVFNIHKGDKFTIDGRYNSFQTNYALVKGDFIKTKFGILKVIAQNGEYINVNEMDEKGKFLNSTKELIVPEGKLGIQNDQNYTTIINLKHIEGKLIKNLR